MQVRLITARRVSPRSRPAELPDLLKRDEGLVWVDIPEPDDEAGRVLSDVFGFHLLAVKDSLERNRVPKAHGYADHVFFILHKPELGERGHVHYIERTSSSDTATWHRPRPGQPEGRPLGRGPGDQCRGNPTDEGRLRPKTPFELSYAIVSSLTRHQEEFLETVTADVWRLEQQVTSGRLGDPEEFIEELFQARHGLLAVRTMAALADAICTSIISLPKLSEDGRAWVSEMAAEFGKVHSVANGEHEYLQGVIDFYQTVLALRSSLATQQQNEAARRLTEASYTQNEDLKKISGWAAILFAPTLVGTVYGMNFDHMPELHWLWGYPLALFMMAGSSLLLHRVFHRSGWL